MFGTNLAVMHSIYCTGRGKDHNHESSHGGDKPYANEGCAVGAQLVSRHRLRRKALLAEQLDGPRICPVGGERETEQ